MAHRPFSPWREGDQLTVEDRIRAESQPPSSLDEIGYRGDAELFRVLRQLAITPNDANEMELWEIGVLLGADLPQRPGIDEEVFEKEKDTLGERAERARQRGIRAEPEPPSEEPVDITDKVMKQMGIRTEP